MYATIDTAKEGEKVTLNDKLYVVVKVEGSLATLSRCDESGKRLAGRPIKATMIDPVVPF